MCGICGIFNLDRRPVDSRLLARMSELVAHRGPDDAGTYIDGWVGLAHRRLKIIDLTEKGRQPMANEDRTVWISCNGEIYNHQAIREELRHKGHRFVSTCDAEVIPHAYEEWGISCIDRLSGMFALALYDAKAQSLFLVRDRLGMKPLFYHADGASFCFASEIKALLASPRVRRQIDPVNLHNYLSLNYVPAPGTLFQGISQVMPAEIVHISARGSERKTYWDLSHVSPAARRYHPARWLEELDERLRQTVRSHLSSDVPFGAFLSGGLDSSALLYYMSAILKTGVQTFSIRFREDGFNEAENAKRVARSLSLVHAFQTVTPQLDEAFFRKLVWHSEEPTADSSMIAVFLLSRFARQSVRMAISGDGADELLAGYETYPAYYLRKIYRLIPPSWRAPLRKGLMKHWPPAFGKVSLDYKLKRFVAGSELPWEEAHFFWRYILDEHQKRWLYTPGFRETIGDCRTFDAIRPYFAAARGKPIQRLLAVDTRFYLPNDMLVKVDRASMAHALEVRLPFLDHSLVEFMAAMPVDLKLKWMCIRKYALRSLMFQRLPHRIVLQKKKGFNVPVNRWIQAELKDLVTDTLSPAQVKAMGIFRPRAVQWLLEQHMSGRQDFGYPIYGLFIFFLWWEMFIQNRDLGPFP